MRAHNRDGDIDIPADLVIGCDGRGSVIRARAALELMQFPQAYDIHGSKRQCQNDYVNNIR